MQHPWVMWLPPILMAGTGLFTGFINGGLSKDLLSPAVSRIIGKSSEVELALWHGFNWVLLLSLLTYVSGWFIYRARHTIRKFFAFSNHQYRLAPERLYFTTLSKLEQISRRTGDILQNGYLRNYIFTIFSFLLLLSGFTYFVLDLFPEQISINLPFSISRVYEFIPILLMLLGMVMIFFSRSRMNILLSASMLGFGVATVFAFFSAPDVSMTQFLVETITIVLFMLILNRLPRHKIIRSNRRRLRHIILSVLFGAMMTLILLSIIEVPMVSEFKEYYLTESKPKGKGENVVNVILIDFRALDTLGEISVLAITALGILALSSLNLKKEER